MQLKPAFSAASFRAGLISLLVLAHLPVASAASVTQDDSWRVTVSPYLWLPSLRGNGEVDGHTGRFHAPFRKLIHDLNFVAMGNMAVTKGRYGAFLDGQYLDLSEYLSFPSSGISGKSSVRSTQLSLGGFYQAYRQRLRGSTLSGTPREWIISPAAGVFWMRMRVQARGDGLSETHTNTRAIPFIGFRSSYDLNRRWNLSTEWDVGTWGRNYNLQGQAYLGYRFKMFDLNSLFLVGGRILHQDYQLEGLHWNVSQYGPVAAISMTF